jgi:DNA-binding XRE family transcriptional regulator
VLKIAELRNSKRLTQREVADLLEVDTSTVRNWEKNREGASMFIKVAKLCDLFECSPWDLVDLAEETP